MGTKPHPLTITALYPLCFFVVIGIKNKKGKGDKSPHSQAVGVPEAITLYSVMPIVREDRYKLKTGRDMRYGVFTD